MIGKGTRHELALARRAVKVVRTHLKNARTGLKGWPDKIVLGLLVEFNDALTTITWIPIAENLTPRPKKARRAA